MIRRVKTKLKDVARKVVPSKYWKHLRAYSRPLSLYETARFNFFPISHEPLVIYTFTGSSLANVFHMSRSLEGRSASFIVGFTRHPADWQLIYLRRQIKEYQSQYPQNRIVFIANSQAELEKVRKYGLDAKFVNKNAFQREDQFFVQEIEEKVYDAVMNARMARWKRVELARKVERLAIITILDEENYYLKMRKVLPESTDWVNFEGQDSYTSLCATEVNHILNQSSTGLILSAHEANNKASIEYLLSGIPVVSTPSKGGREVFFEEEYCAIVEPTPEAVKEGVDSMITRDVDPEYIRRKTLDKIRDHRRRFLSLVSDLTDGRFSASVDQWLELFPRNMEFQCQPKHFREFLESDFLAGRPQYRRGSYLREENPELWHSITGDTSK